MEGLHPAALELLRSLAAHRRESATGGSRAAAAAIADALRDLGLRPEIEHERVHGTYWWPPPPPPPLKASSRRRSSRSWS